MDASPYNLTLTLTAEFEEIKGNSIVSFDKDSLSSFFGKESFNLMHDNSIPVVML